MALEQKFGKVLKQERARLKISQEKLTHRCGMHVATISFYERGIKSPTIHSVFLIAEALGMKASDLLAEVEEFEN